MFFRLVQKYSLPLLVGLVLGVVYANYDYDYYQYWLGGGHCCEEAPGNPNGCLPAFEGPLSRSPGRRRLRPTAQSGTLSAGQGAQAEGACTSSRCP